MSLAQLLDIIELFFLTVASIFFAWEIIVLRRKNRELREQNSVLRIKLIHCELEAKRDGTAR